MLNSFFYNITHLLSSLFSLFILFFSQPTHPHHQIQKRKAEDPCYNNGGWRDFFHMLHIYIGVSAKTHSHKQEISNIT